jgi:hypothetical protein
VDTNTSNWYTIQAQSDVDMNSNKITNLEPPTNPQDATTKLYVDDITGNTLESKLHPLGIPDDIISTHFDGEISENITTSNGWVTKIWDATGKGHNYTASEAMNYAYNSTQKRLEMTAASGQRMKDTLPSGNSTQAYSWTIVSELSERNESNWEKSAASVIFNLFNSNDGTDNRANAYYADDNFQIAKDDLLAGSSNFWNQNKYSKFKAPQKLIITANYNSNDNATDFCINNRWFGQTSIERNNDEVVIGNDDDVAPHDFSFYGYIYECFYTNDSLSETQLVTSMIISMINGMSSLNPLLIFLQCQVSQIWWVKVIVLKVLILTTGFS